MSKVIQKDVAIVGAGPVGLFTVFEMGLLGYNCVVIDSLPQIGGQCSELYPEKPIYDIPAYPMILAGELADKLDEQIKPFNPEYVLGDEVTTLEGEAGNFTLTAGETTIKAKVIVVAAGAGVFTPRKPPIANLADFEKKSVFYAVKKKDQFKDKTVVIAGGGDSAVDWAVALGDICTHIHVVHRRDDFRAAEATVQKMRELEAEGKLTLHTPYQLKELTGKDGNLTQVTLAKRGDEDKVIDADNLLCFFGLVPSLGPLAKWGLGIAKKKIVVEPATMQTTVPGILGSGDITEYPGKLDLILTGFAESAIAAKTAQGIIEPDKRFKLIYTTSSGVPGE
ncbi:MAG: NAD(P)/FAD-dependent oxidoreductase [Pseudomonadota bacterium]|nr:NAD(P)/FAD-dependent oxidoreductase [Pseudomonadota bacterium]